MYFIKLIDNRTCQYYLNKLGHIMNTELNWDNKEARGGGEDGWELP
jgi:hypothetical protein